MGTAQGKGRARRQEARLVPVLNLVFRFDVGHQKFVDFLSVTLVECTIGLLAIILPLCPVS